MTTENDLDKYKQALLDYYRRNENHKLYQLGKEIHEDLKPKVWSPEEKKFYFECTNTFLTDSSAAMQERQCNTLNEAERRLKQEQILNTINAWILEENDKTGWVENDNQYHYFISYQKYNKVWEVLCDSCRIFVGMESSSLESMNELVSLLNADLIKDVPSELDN